MKETKRRKEGGQLGNRNAAIGAVNRSKKLLGQRWTPQEYAEICAFLKAKGLSQSELQRAAVFAYMGNHKEGERI